MNKSLCLCLCFVLPRQAVYSRLRVDGEEAVSVESLERVGDGARLGLQRPLDPGKRAHAPLLVKHYKTKQAACVVGGFCYLEEVREYVPELLRGVDVSLGQPELLQRGGGLRGAVAARRLAKRRRARVAPATVREVVPLSSPCNVPDPQTQ
jgi:hypothetical protein